MIALCCRQFVLSLARGGERTSDEGGIFTAGACDLGDPEACGELKMLAPPE